VLEGSSPAPPPSLPPPRPDGPTPDPRSTGGRGLRPPDPPTRWRLVRDVLGRRTEAEIDHGGRSQLPEGGALVERNRGTVGAGPDGETWARGSAHYRLQWPEATVATSVRLDLRGDAEAFEVQLDLEAREGTSRAGPAAGAAASPASSPDAPSPEPPMVDPPPEAIPGTAHPAGWATVVDPSFSFCP
jgi:hypothetical protein